MESFDYQSQFEKVKKDIELAFSKVLDVQADQTGLRLKAKEVWVDDQTDSADWQSQREAILKDKVWGVPVYANVELADRRTGKVVSTARRVKLAVLPKPTDFGSFIVDGKHYQVQNQLRRKPGIYITEKKNGEPKTEFNIAGRPFDVEITKDATFKLIQGDKEVPLYPILSRLGISDGVLARAWGDDVLAKNKAISAKRSADAMTKAAGFFQTGQTFDSPDDASKALAAYFDATELRPEVTARTVGKEFDRVTPESIVHGSKELLKTIQGERSTDDRQALEYKKIYALSDIMRERFLKPNGELATHMNEFRKKIHRKLNNQRTPPTDVSQLIGPGQFAPALTTFFTQSKLANTTDQTNPLHMLNGMNKVTVMGEGGVSDPMKVRAEERSVHPSQLGFVDPIHTPDSETIGVTMNLPVGVTKRGDQLETMVYDLREKKTRRVTPSEIANLTVSFPDQFEDGKPVEKKVKAFVRGELQLVDPDDVDVVIRTARQAFSITSNTIPFLPSNQGVRAQMATKMMEQAIPLVEREAPLVQVRLGGKTMEQAVGSGFSVRAIEDGVVKSVSKNRVVITTKDGEIEHPLYSNLPLNNKSFVDAVSKVKVGDQVKKDDVLADSNFTSDGTLAIGTNLRAAYIPWKGYNFEDGIVITDDAAKKLTSEHLHQFATVQDASTMLGLDQFLAHKPGGLDLDQQDKLDGDGVVKKGTILRKGDPLWVGVRENRFDPDYIALKRLSPNMPAKRGYLESWNEDVEGEVTDVVRAGKKVKVYVKTREPAQIGDKLTNRHGGKGIITKIIPTGEAPTTADGSPIDILLNPHGIVTRINPSQMLETAAAKLAQKEGNTVTKPYIVNNFSGENYAQTVTDQLKKAGISDTETLFDPHSKEALGEVLVGPQYVLKLTKQATSQFSARSEGKYDIHGNPLRGGDEGAKSLDLITFYSMLAHGSRANLREMATYKATKNQPFWDWLASAGSGGLLKPEPEPTFAYKKFESYLKAAGINTKRNGSKLVLQPMTDVETNNLSSGKVEEPIFLRGKDLKEEKGGLMDPVVFGGRQGTRWGHIELAEPVPNPVFESPIKTLTGLKDTQYRGLVRGELWVDPNTGEWGEEQDPATVTGGAAIKALLGKIDVDQQIASWTDKAKTAKTAQTLDKANKNLKYLHALKKLKVRPEDAYVQTKIPVVPPQFRPIIEMDDGTLSNPGLNTLYRDIGLVNNELKWQNDAPFVPDSMSSELRENLYNGMKALAGIGEPIAYYPGSRKPKGVIEQIKGEPAKRGYFQYDVLRRRQNLVGRGTIIPEPKLGVDEVGLPEEMSWTLFEPFITRRLVSQSGMKPDKASEEVANRTQLARSALQAEMDERPVMLNRAPSLHKFSIMAFRPQMTEGKAIKIPPLVVKGFNADFDGDAMTVHVPVLQDAVDEAKNMLPSKNLYNPGTGAIMLKPQNEAALGLYLLSKDPEKKEQILGQLPESLRARYADRVLDGDGLRSLMAELVTELPREHGKVVDRLKQLGDEHAYRAGFSVGLKDLLPDIPEKEGVFNRTKKALSGVKTNTIEGRAEALDIIGKANKELTGILEARLPEQGNNFDLMVRSGARGNMNQLKQIVSAPFMVDDHRGQPQAIPIMKSFAEGLPFSDYWNTLYGARAAAVDKQLQTSAPGAFNKDIMATAINQVISNADSSPQEGIDLPVDNRSNDLEERFLARDIKIGNTVIAKAGDQVSAQLLNTLRDRKISNVRVMSPLTDPTPQGMSAKSYGINERGQLPSIGDNVGAISGQAMSEPLTQMTMRTFHQGGISGTRGVVSGYEAIDKLLKMHEIKRNKATLAPIGGKVAAVEDAPGGLGKHVHIDGLEDPVFIERDLWDPARVRTGSEVRRGDILSKGLVQPQELVKLKGMLPAQNYIVDEIHKAYGDQGVHLKRRAIETVVRAAGNTTKVLDPGDSTFLPGDIAPWTMVEHHNNQKLGDLALDEIDGHPLLEEIPGATVGEPITDKLKSVLKRLGKHKVSVGPRPIKHEPFLAGIQRVPMLRSDWLSQMGYRNLAEALVGGAAELRESDLHGYAPVPAFAYGAEFGDAPKGKSKTEGVY